MAIMVNGPFQYIGSRPTEHLKTEFGEGYSLIIKLRVSFIHSFVNRELTKRNLKIKSPIVETSLGR